MMESCPLNIVYGICDSSTSEIRYVGKSFNGLVRPYSHFVPNIGKHPGSNKALCEWIQEEIKAGRHPDVKILATCAKKDLLRKEKDLIKQHSSPRLFNKNHNVQPKREILLDLSDVTKWPWSKRKFNTEA